MCHFFLAQALHDHTVFAEGEGCCGRMFQAIEPVTNCDQFSFFFRRKPKGEIHREAVRVSFDGLVQGLCRDAVYFSQICIDNYAMPPDGEDPTGDAYLPKGWQQCVGMRFQILAHAVGSFNYCAQKYLPVSVPAYRWWAAEGDGLTD